MKYIDDTQKVLTEYLIDTEKILNELLSIKPYQGQAKIIPNLDLGFPHDVIRLAGGFATGMCVCWESKIPFVPVDICMNACTVSLYHLANKEIDFFNENSIKELLQNIDNSSYKANFHRGNHFISLLESLDNGEYYIIIHSSAAEFETMFNGLYPVEGNYIYENTKIYYSNNRYIRYIDGQTAELYLKLASNLYTYNENRHDFIIATLLKKYYVKDSNHYHHYGMPVPQIALLGSHLISRNQTVPLLTRPGESVYLICYKNVKDSRLLLTSNSEFFITPHGLGKHHTHKIKMQVDCESSLLELDEKQYNIKYGESLRSHPGLELRNINLENYFSYFSKFYDFNIEKEFRQVASYNKDGYKQW